MTWWRKSPSSGMLGNDVVCLRHFGQHHRTRQARYRRKVYTARELGWLDRLPPSQADAIAWAMKESAYKAYFRLRPQPLMSPKRFEIMALSPVDSSYEGKVQTPVGPFDMVVELTADYVHAVATQPGFPLRFQSDVVRATDAWQVLVRRRGVPVTIRKDAHGIPNLYEGNRRFPLSMSHDHGWLAFVVGC